MAAIDYRNIENHMVAGLYIFPTERPDWDDTDDTEEVDA